MNRLMVLGIVAVLFASTASSQNSNKPATPNAEIEALKPANFGIVGGFMLVTQKSVQEELKLSDDQIKKFEAAQAQQRESYQGLRDLDQKERAKKLARPSVEGEESISEILKPEQIKRFQEISRQQDGLLLSVVAKDGHIAAALKLTDDQKGKIKTIGEEMGTEMRAAFKAAGGDRSKTAAKMQELLKSGNEKLMKLLTEEQKTKWKELIGEPIRHELNPPQGGPQPEAAKAEKDTRYLAFQIFTFGPNPLMATMGEGKNPQPARFPDKAALRDYIEDIKRRIGAVGDQQTRLAVMLGHFSFDHGDAETTRFIELGFELALETDLAVGFHIDDSMFWARRKDLWSDPNNVEALDWDGTPCTGRRLNWGKEPSAAPPQMCFNSIAIQREVQERSTLLGKAIQAGVNRLRQLNRPELFAGVIAGSETQIGQDFKTGKYLGYRALLNRGFSREHPPKDMDLEREKVVQEFIELWSKGLADAGVSPQKIYSHICFLSRRSFGLGDSKEITYMQRKGEITYSQHIHFTPPSVAFGKHHRPGFSTYPQPGLFDDIYEQLAKHKQAGWASCEGTNMQPEGGPGQTGMGMETYLAKMFNRGATLTTIFSWGVGGEANKSMGFRVVTEGEEALRAYRKFLTGEPLIEGKSVASLTERLPPKIHQIQRELPAWMQQAGNEEKAAKAAALMQKMQEQLKAKNFEEVEKIADAILKLMGVSAQAAAQGGENNLQQTLPSTPLSDDPTKRLTHKVESVTQVVKKWTASGRDPSDIVKAMTEQFKPLMDAGKVALAEAELDRLLEQLGKDVQ